MTHSTPPAVSILTPMKNAAPWVAETIASVRAQTFQDWEMHIIDDGSTDNSLGVAQAAAQGDARILIGPNTTGIHGAAGTRNAGLAMARGRYIAFLDADDVWDPTKLERQIATMRQYGWVFSWTSYRAQPEDSLDLPLDALPIRQAKTRATRYDLLSKKAPIGCLTAVYDRAAFGSVPMETSLKTQEDFVLWARLAQEVEAANWGMGGLDEALATYRLRGQSLSANKAKVVLRHWRVLRHHCGQSPFQAAALFAAYAYRGVKDRLALHKRP